MISAIDCAKYILQNCVDIRQDAEETRVKLQQLLFLTNMVSLAKTGELLFGDPVYAVDDGFQVETVYARFNNSMTSDLHCQHPAFSQDAIDVLSATIAVYESARADELSRINQSFDFWERNVDKSSGVPINELRNGLGTMRKVLSAYEALDKHCSSITISGVKFAYDSDETHLSDEDLAEIANFVLIAEDDEYMVCYDEDRLVIY